MSAPLRFHWKVSVGAPAAEIENVAAWPSITRWLCGAATTIGAATAAALASAAPASSSPAPHCPTNAPPGAHAVPGGKARAVLRMYARTSPGVAEGRIDLISAATPATCGVAALVPLKPPYAAPLRPCVSKLSGVVGLN